MMVAVVLLPVLVGLPVVRLCAGSRVLSDEEWCVAPFVGGALLILPLQAAFYWGIPIQTAARPWVGALLLIGLALAWLTRRRGGWGTPPWAIAFAATAVYAFHGAGLLRVGAQRYLGRAWVDQFNYISTAEFLLRHPFGDPIQTGWPFDEWIGASASAHRIGQSVLHALFSVLMPVGTKAWFEPLILWSAFLVPLALYVIGRRLALSPRPCLIAAIGGGLLPATAMIHLESFFSHALAGPFLLLVLALVARMREHGRLGDAVLCALVSAVTTALYYEFVPLILAAGFWLLCSTVPIREARTPRRIVGAVLPIVSPFLLNHVYNLIAVVFTVSAPILGALYPWAYSVEGIQRLWVGDLVLRAAVLDSPIVRAGALALAAAGFFGWATRLLRQASTWRSADHRFVSEALLTLLAAGLACLPPLLMVADAQHGYQVYKLWLTFAPLLPIGVALQLQTFRDWSAARGRGARVAYGAACTAAIVAIGCAALGTGDMVLAATAPGPNDLGRRQATIAISDEFAQAERLLASMPGRDIVICVSDRTLRGYLNGWLGHFSRTARSWPMNYIYTDRDLRIYAPEGDYLRGFPTALASDSLFVTAPVGAMWADGSAMSLLWRGPTIAYRRASEGPYALACHPDIRPSYDGRTSDITLHARGREILVAARGSIEATLFIRGANQESVSLLRELELRVNGAPTTRSESRRGLSLHTFPLRDGLNRLEFKVNRTGREPSEWPSLVEATHLRLLLGHDWVVLEHIENPNGAEVLNGELSYWLGRDDLLGTVVAGREGTMTLRFRGEPVTIGRDTTGPRRVRVSTGTGYSTILTVATGDNAIEIPVVRGRQQIRLEALDLPDATDPDAPRPRLVALQKLKAELVPAD